MQGLEMHCKRIKYLKKTPPRVLLKTSGDAQIFDRNNTFRPTGGSTVANLPHVPIHQCIISKAKGREWNGRAVFFFLSFKKPEGGWDDLCVDSIA